jgi:hypothetical protein
MRRIELYKAHVDRDQQRLSSRLQRSIQEQIRSNNLTRPKAQYAPLNDNYNGHVTENSVYVPDITGHQRKTRFDDQLEIRDITELEKTQMEAIDRLNKN